MVSLFGFVCENTKIGKNLLNISESVKSETRVLYYTIAWRQAAAHWYTRITKMIHGTEVANGIVPDTNYVRDSTTARYCEGTCTTCSIV